MGNSVIYRPAYDAEVEYLESDANSFIDTGLKASSELGVLAHIQNSTGGQNWLFGGGDGNRKKEFAFLEYSTNETSHYRFGTSLIENAILDADIIYEFDNTQSHNIMKVGNITYTAPSTTFESSSNLILFGLNRNGVLNKSTGVRIYDFKIYKNSTLVSDFIPVRIGSVGYMYDKVTKQLFANKGTGSFTLGNDVSNAVIPQQRCVLYFGSQRSVVFERIYEEYEWLKTTLNSQGTYMTLPINSDNLSFKRIISSVANSSWMVTNGFSYFSYSTTGDTPLAISCWDSNQSKSVFWLYKKFDEEIEVVSTSNSLTFGGTSARQYGYPIQNVRFSNGNNGTSEFKTSSITVDGSVRYIPCKLLQSIPAILDGNGIARQAGTCGMWDKVSGRFYGNVSKSGTFTVKGPKCYEEYKWLKITLPKTNNVYQYVPINSDTFGFTIIIESGYNVGILNTNKYWYYSANSTNTMIGVWNTYDSVDEKFTSVGSSQMIFESSNSNFQINGVSITKYGFPVNRLMYYSKGRDLSELISSITVDGSVRYVPCKLTHYIPASMDANGIPRQSGECGFWDKINDVFYGNVASSGSFTVSND